MPSPLLVVTAGLPGTGKTTLARRLAAATGEAYLRVDAIETAVIRCGLAEPPVGPVGYVVAQEVAAGTLRVGTSVVVDAVNPVPKARAGWRDLAARCEARLVVLETVLTDQAEHRRRVSLRQPDLDGQRVPTWEDVQRGGYVPWDEARDGRRHLVDTADTEAAVAAALAALRS